MSDTILIAGASKGIGLATAHLLAGRGANLIGLARTRPDRFPGDFLEVDLSDASATRAVLERVSAKHPAIDGLVNCAGLNIPEAIGEVDLDNLLKVLDFNIRTAVQCTQAVLPAMKERRFGRIVNISSRGALGRPKRTAYAAAKAGIVGLSRTWALELATFGITVNVVSPGPTETEMFRRNNLVGPQAEENRRFFLADVPMGRFGQPEEIATAIAFFLGRDASFITGQVLHACGGSSVGPAPL